MKCEACEEDFPGLDKHHLIPLEYGGKKEGKIANLCGSCHDSLHRIAESDGIIENIPTYLLYYVLLVRKAKQNYQAGSTIALDKRNKTQLTLSSNERKMIEWLKIKWNLTSIEKVLKVCLIKSFESEF